MTDSPPDRLTAALADRYRIERPLGEGGMATVYLAEDLKHERRVAIKVLKPELAAVIGGERFVSEIKTTAQLQHPHILPLFDSGGAEGFLYYVMPYIEGESLRDRLDREKQLGVDEALELTKAVADALDYAHRNGVIHRDIKPANILLHDGRPVVADFGIAVAISAAGGGRMTETGLSLGTPHYMSPEQATADRDLTARSDIYSLACVLYEMLTGDPPHTASTAQAVLVRILTEAPRPVTAVRSSVPPHVSAVLAKALEKLPADRFRTAEAFREALDDEHFTYTARSHTLQATSSTPPPEASDRRRLGTPGSKMALAGMAAVGITGFLLGWALTRGTDTGGMGSDIVHRYVIADSTRQAVLMDISRRGDVVYTGSPEGDLHLRLRPAADTAPIPLPGTEGGNFPVFSPNGEWIAFSVDQRELKKIQPSTGTVVTLLTAPEFQPLFPSDWTEDGQLLFTTSDGVYRIADTGGEPELIREAREPFFARMLPDGRTLIHSVGGINSQSVVTLDLQTGAIDTVVATGGNPQWSPTGHILHGHPSGTVFAVPYDLERRQATGPGIPARESVFTVGGSSFYRLSPSGSLLYVAGGNTGLDIATSGLAWMDMEGEVTGIRLGPIDHADIRLSPDGRSIAYTDGGQIHIFDLQLGTNQRFTFEGSEHHDPVWSPDGSRIAFSSDRGAGSRGIWLKDAGGRASAELLVSAELPMSPHEWLGDGTIVVTRGLGENSDIGRIHVDSAETELRPLLRADWAESQPQVSPDGDLMAYISSEIDGEGHLFVREFPSMAGRWQVSEEPILTDGFASPLWSGDGSALFYQRRTSGTVIRAEIEREPTFRVVERRELPGTATRGILEDLHPDGNRFLISLPGGELSDSGVPPLIVAVNWIAELRERLDGR